MTIEKEVFADSVQRIENAFPGWKLSGEAIKFWKRELESRGIQSGDLRKAVDRVMEISGARGVTFPDLLKVCRDAMRERMEVEHRRAKENGVDIFAQGVRSHSPFIRAVSKANSELLSMTITKEEWEERVKEANKLKEGR